MESALIVSCTKSSVAFFTEMLNAASCTQILTLPTCGEARRLLLERSFDLVVINAPLTDESGESLSRHVAAREQGQVILVVKGEHYHEITAACEDDGVLTVAKPLSRSVFWSALKLASSAQARLRRVRAENDKLKQKIEDIRLVDRAKCLLIARLSMSEQDAHRFIEKQAMDMRATRREIAQGILKTYED